MANENTPEPKPDEEAPVAAKPSQEVKPPEVEAQEVPVPPTENATAAGPDGQTPANAPGMSHGI